MALVKHTNNSLSNITALPSAVPTGKMTLLSTATASSSANITFNESLITDDYLIYKFEFINIHPSADGSALQVNFRDGGSAYDATKTTTYFLSRHAEDGSSSELSYKTGLDLAQSTAVQKLTVDADNDNDSSQSGEMFLFNPSSTVFIKHFISRIQTVQTNAQSMENYASGYCNVTAAIDAVQFTSSSGTLDAGQIKLYGLAN